jgi:hypothetical protein
MWISKMVGRESLTQVKSGACWLSVTSFSLVHYAFGASLPPLVCPGGGPIGSVDVRVESSHASRAALPLRTINRLEEGDTILYRPLLRSKEDRKGEVAIVLVPVNKRAVQDSLLILEPKAAGKPQQWRVPWRVAVVAYVYGPSGLNVRKVQSFLSSDDELIAQLADYAEKTAQTEALLAALSSPYSSSASVQAALEGFSSQYGLSMQLDRAAPTNQQALTLFQTLNPALASYDPIVAQRGQPAAQTATLATAVAALFFGSPVGLAAGGTALLMDLRSIAFPRAEFRSSFSQPLPDDGLGLCGRRDLPPPHTKIAYIWASRVPNVGPPQLSIEKSNSLPPGVKSPIPVTAADGDWKFVDRARNWGLLPDQGSPLPVKVQKLGDTKTLELDVGPYIPAGKYTLVADWDWDQFKTKGRVEINPLADFASTRLTSSSRERLSAKAEKTAVTLEGSDFEFVTKVESETLGDEFATPVAVPFLLPGGLRGGRQDHMDIQLNTATLSPGRCKLILSQVDGKAHPVILDTLPQLVRIDNLPMILNHGSLTGEFNLKGQRLDLLTGLEVQGGTAVLGPSSLGQAERKVTLVLETGSEGGTNLALKAYKADIVEPSTYAAGVHIRDPLPRITSIKVTQPPDQRVELHTGELPGGVYLSAMIHAEHLQANSEVKLGCDSPSGATLSVHLRERAGPVNLPRISAQDLFLSFDTAPLPNGCQLHLTAANGSDGESDPYPIGRIVRVPKIERFEPSEERLTGQNLETIEKAGWTSTQGRP